VSGVSECLDTESESEYLQKNGEEREKRQQRCNFVFRGIRHDGAKAKSSGHARSYGIVTVADQGDGWLQIHVLVPSTFLAIIIGAL